MAGAGTLSLGGTNTFTGSLTINSGTLQLNNSSALGTSGAIVTLNGGTLDLYGYSPAIAALNSLRQEFDRPGHRHADHRQRQRQLHHRRHDQRPGRPERHRQRQTTILSGSNTFSGQTTLYNSTLTLANSQALSMSTVDFGTNGGWLKFGTLTMATLGQLTGTNAIGFGDDLLLNSTGGLPVTLQIGNNNSNSTFTGQIGGSGSLEKVGTGRLTLSGVDSYQGSTTVLGGVLDIESISALPSGSTLAIANTAEVVFGADLGSAVELSMLLPGAGSQPGMTYFRVTNTAPVPEPGTFVLLAAAAAVGVAACARRRKSANCD